MYAYDELDRTLINERVSEFRDQVKRRLSGELTEDEFKMLRLQNSVYLQLHAYMFRVAIPYGTLSSKQLRRLAHIARRYDRGYGHFTTRQNIQFNWIKLSDLPDALADLAEVGIHAMQTSGNNMRNVTSDQWAGVARARSRIPHLVGNPAPAHHAASGILVPAAQVQDRDHRLRARPRRDQGPRHRLAPAQERGRRNRFRGAGRRRSRPHAVHRQDHQAVRARPRHLSYVEAILRVYNQYGRRDNIYKARIKILVHELGIEKFSREVEEEWKQMGRRPDARSFRDRGGALAFLLSGLRKAAAHAGRAEAGRA